MIQKGSRRHLDAEKSGFREWISVQELR